MDSLAVPGYSPGERVQRQAKPERGIAGNEVAALFAPEPRARPPGIGFPAEGKDMARHLVQALMEQPAKPRALERVLQARIERVDVGRQLALAPQVVPGVLISGKDVLRFQSQPRGEAAQEKCSARFVGSFAL